MQLEDLNHLKFIYGRMKYIHNENENFDYMIKFKSIINSYEKLKSNSKLEKKKNYIKENKNIFDQLYISNNNSIQYNLYAKWIEEGLKDRSIYSEHTNRIDIISSIMKTYKKMYNIKDK